MVTHLLPMWKHRGVPVDELVRSAAERATASLPAARRRAVLAVLGWRGAPVSLAEAATLGDVSRETVRRDRDRVSAALSWDQKLAAVARDVRALADAADSDLAVLGPVAAARGIVADPAALEAVVLTLAAGGHLPPVVRGPARTASLVVDDEAAPRRELRAALSTGVPHEVSEDEQRTVVDELVLEQHARWLLTPRWASLPAQSVADSPTGRALRRVLTMTGPLVWADLLSAWARGAGKAPYEPLPARTDVLDAWVTGVPGLRLEAPGGPVAAVDPPVELDRTSTFLREALNGKPAGRERVELLEAAESAGLRRSGVAATLSHHPALVSVQRGRWALRTGSTAELAAPEAAVAAARGGRTRPRKARPTTFTWTPAGELVLEISVPAGPSPVVAVPRAVADVLDGARLIVRTPHADAMGEMVVRSARAWGFGPALAACGVRPGERAALTCDLVAGAVTVTPVPPTEGTP